MTDARSKPLRLWVWLVVALTVVMLPLSLVALQLAQTARDESDRLAQQVLLARTEAAAAPVRGLLQSALGAAEALGTAALLVQDDRAACSRIFAEYVSRTEAVILGGFVTAEGQMICSPTGETRDFSRHPLFLQERELRRPHFEVSQRGSLSGQSILGVIFPVLRADLLEGFVFLSLPNNSPASGWRHPGGGDVDVLTLNSEGRILTATVDLTTASELLPDGISAQDIVARADQGFVARSQYGAERFYAISTLIPGRVFVMGSYPVAQASMTLPRWRTMTPVIVPLAAWATAVLAGLAALRWLVGRHLTALAEAMRRFAMGERDAPTLRLTRPPQEFADAEAAFADLVSILSRAEQQADRDLAEKSLLLREVHHRVKNNLQLIASITHMQARTAQSDEARQLLQSLQRRVRGLANVHLALHGTPGETRVDARVLLRAIISEAKPDLVAKLDPLWLYPDQAVPFSMLVTEALGPGAVDGAGAAREVILRVTDDVAHIEIRFDGGATQKDAASQLSARLLEGFAQQLDGQITRSETAEGIAILVTFVFQDALPDPD